MILPSFARSLALCLWTLAALLPARALPADARWQAMSQPLLRHYTVDNGLAYNYVSSIAQDTQGYMWLGTQNGLMRFDGYRFRVYKHDPQDAGSLPSDFVNVQHVDPAGRLWIGTLAGDLARYDRAHGRFVSYRSAGRRA